MSDFKGRHFAGEIKAGLDGAQLVAGDRLLDRQPALETAHWEPCAVEGQFDAAEADSLADAQASGTRDAGRRSSAGRVTG